MNGLTKRAVDNTADNAMSLSREIIVLDFGDEATNPYDFDKISQGEKTTGNSKIYANLHSVRIILNYFPEETDYKLDAVSWPGRSEEVFSSQVEEVDTCPTRTSVLALSVVCALLLVLYICTMFYFCMRKVILQNQKVGGFY